MSQDEQKRLAAQAALDFIESGDIVGVGTGSTTNFFIDALAEVKGRSTASCPVLRHLPIG